MNYPVSDPNHPGTMRPAHERLKEIIATRIQLGPQDKGDGVWNMIKSHWANEGYNKAVSDKDAEVQRLKGELAIKERAIRELSHICQNKDQLITELADALDQAYYERNKLVRFLASLFPSGIARTDIPGWEPEWHNCVFIDTPQGQMSWQYHDTDVHLFASLPPYEKPWDGHSTMVREGE